MFRLKIVLILILSIFFSGCSQFFTSVNTVPLKKVEKPIILPVKEQMIKGVIVDLVYSESGWCYTINSTDTSNNKLKSGIFCGDSHEFSYGDLIYATIVNNRIKKMLLIQKKYLPHKNLDSRSLKKPIIKRFGNKKIAEVPKTEQIRFD